MPSSLTHRIIDWEKRKITVVFADGRRQIEELTGSTAPPDGFRIVKSVLDVERWWMVHITQPGDLVISEVYSPVATDPLKGRPVVYLDQNHWRTLATVKLDPSKVRKPSEIEPAKRLFHLAGDGGVVLPVSGGNLLETSALHDPLRYQLGLVMAQLSAGWQMRHPIRVQRMEIAQTLNRMLGTRTPRLAQRAVMTLEPYAALAEGPDAGELDRDDPILWQLANTSSLVLLSVLVDPEALPKTVPAGWVTEHQDFTDHLATTSHPASMKRTLSYARTFSDIRFDIAQEVDVIDVLLERKLQALKEVEHQEFLHSTPMLRMLSTITMFRHTDRCTKWKPNDLIDMLYLSCAAGYADYLVAEAHTVQHLTQAQRLCGLSENAHPTLESLVEALDRDGVRTVTERAS